MAHVLAKDLREAVLQAAFEGKLSYKEKNDTPLSLITTYKNEFPFDIPDNWKWFNLKDLVWNRKQKKPDKTFCYIDIGSIDNVHLQLNEMENVMEASNAPSRARKTVKYGDIIYSTVRPYLHNMAIINKEFSFEPIVSTGFATMTCNNGVLNRYLFLYLQSPSFDKYANDKDNSKGVAYPAINDKKLYSAPVPLPPIEEQARIVAKVDELMAKIDEYEKLEKELTELKEKFPGEMRDAILQAAMEGKISERKDNDTKSLRNNNVETDEYDSYYPTEWSIVKLRDISNIYTGNSIPETVKKSKYMGLNEGLNYIGTKDVGFDHKVDYENGVKIPLDEPNFKTAHKNATLLCIEGGSAGKKIGMITEDVCFGNKLCSFNPTEHINNKYQYFLLQSPIFKKQFSSNISGMIGGVSVNKLKELLVPLPSIEEQQRIVEKLDKLLPMCDELVNLC